MFSNDLLHRVVGRIESRFDGVSPDLLSRVAREVLIAAETDRADSNHVRRDSADTPAPKANSDAALERGRAYRDQAAAALSQQWKKGA
jgi:hypothetical protein